MARKRKRLKQCRNTFEEKVRECLEENDITFEYEADEFPYVLRKKYVPDFKLSDTLYLEAKGYFDQEARRKMLAVKEQYPDKKFVFVFAKDNRLRKGSKKRYSDWCRENGFEFVLFHNLKKYLEKLRRNGNG